jgi:hypothetical protein
MARLFTVVVGILAVQGSLTAGSILGVAFFPPSQVSCDTTLVSSADSETLTPGACTGTSGPVSILGDYVSATADPLKVEVDGQLGNELNGNNFQDVYAISATAGYEGSLEAVGGTGSAFLEFDVQAFGANFFLGDFAIPSLGINYPVLSFIQRAHYLVPVTFGDPINYSLLVENMLTQNEPDVMMAGLSLDNLEVVNANGVPIAGAAVITSAPEPGTAGLLGAGVAVLALASRLRRRLSIKVEPGTRVELVTSRLQI